MCSIHVAASDCFSISLPTVVTIYQTLPYVEATPPKSCSLNSTTSEHIRRPILLMLCLPVLALGKMGTALWGESEATPTLCAQRAVALPSSVLKCFTHHTKRNISPKRCKKDRATAGLTRTVEWLHLNQAAVFVWSHEASNQRGDSNKRCVSTCSNSNSNRLNTEYIWKSSRFSFSFFNTSTTGDCYHMFYKHIIYFQAVRFES